MAGADATERGQGGQAGPPRRNPSFPVGIDYHPVDDERHSWEDWYDKDIEGDFERFQATGLSLVRVFVSWRMYEPQVGQYSDDADDRMGRLVAAARAHGLRLVVDLFADDPLTEPAAVPWGAKRDPRTDSYMIQREVALAQRIVSRLRTEQAVFAWELANEAFCARFTSPDDLLAWVRSLREAIREVDTDRPILLPLDPETLTHATGIDATAALDECEIVASHVTSPYRGYAAEGPITSGPATYLPSFLLRNAARGERLTRGEIHRQRGLECNGVSGEGKLKARTDAIPKFLSSPYMPTFLQLKIQS